MTRATVWGQPLKRGSLPRPIAIAIVIAGAARGASPALGTSAQASAGGWQQGLGQRAEAAERPLQDRFQFVFPPSGSPRPHPELLRGGCGAIAQVPLISGALRGGMQEVAMASTRRGFVSTSIRASLGMIFGVAKVAAIPYIAMLALLFTFQRALIFPRPSEIANPEQFGGKLVLLKASEELQTRFGVEPKSAQPSSSSSSEASAPAWPAGNVAAVHYRAPTEGAPTLVYIHGNADQIGWGAAYLGQALSQRYGMGFYGIEFPGYGVSGGFKTNEESMYLAAEQLLRHLQAKDGLGVDPANVVLVGQSIGSAVAMEMSLRGFGKRLILIAPFLSMGAIAKQLFPFIKPGLFLAPWLIRDPFNNAEKGIRVAVPAMVVHGDWDEIVSYEQGKALSKIIPGAQLFTVSRGGHNDLFGSDLEPLVLGAVAAFVSEGVDRRAEDRAQWFQPSRSHSASESPPPPSPSVPHSDYEYRNGESSREDDGPPR